MNAQPSTDTGCFTGIRQLIDNARQHGETLIILLAGGDKSSQARDIRTALRLA